MNIQKYLNNLKQPFTNMDYYKQSVNKTFWSSFLSMFIAFTLMGLISGFIFVKKQIPEIVSTIQTVTLNSSQNYPEDLVVEWTGTKLTANRDYIELPWPDDEYASSQEESLPEKFLYFDNSEKTPEDMGFTTQDYLLYINNNTMYYINEETGNTWTAQPLAEISQETTLPITIDKNLVDDLATQLSNFIGEKYNTIAAIGFVLATFAFVSGKMWFIAIETLLVILLFKLYSIKLTTKQTAILSMHVMIPVVVLNTLAELIYENINFPLQTIAFWILIIVISFQFKKIQQE